jgi:ORF6N domain
MLPAVSPEWKEEARDHPVPWARHVLRTPKGQGKGQLSQIPADKRVMKTRRKPTPNRITRSCPAPALAADGIEQAILVLRGHRVLLDTDLAVMYGVAAKALNQAVKRNIERFPSDFMFQLSVEEAGLLRSQSVTSKSQGGRRYLPYAFTEQGVAMLSSVLRSPRAVQVNIEIMRAFVRLRRMLQQNAELARKLAVLERKCDARFKTVFEAIRELMTPPERPKRQIGFVRRNPALRRGGRT